MTATTLTAADATNAYSQLGGNDGTMVIQSGPNGGKINAINLDVSGGVKPSYTNASAVSTTSSFNYSVGTHGQVCLITMTNAITVTFGAPANITEGAMYKFILKAGDTSARTYAWNAAYKFPSATAPLTAGTTTSGAYDIITFIGGASNTLVYDGHTADVR